MTIGRVTDKMIEAAAKKAGVNFSMLQPDPIPLNFAKLTSFANALEGELIEAAKPRSMKVRLFDLISFNTYFNFRSRGGFGQISVGIKRDGDNVVIHGSNELLHMDVVRAALHGVVDEIMDHVNPVNDCDMKTIVPVPSEILAAEARFEAMCNEAIGEPKPNA